MRVHVEVCATTLAQVRLAARSGVEHVELCTWLACGGVTPSSGMARCAAAIGIPQRVLIRSLPGPFVPDEEERAAMLSDALALREHAFGLVIGALGPDDRIDPTFVKAICANTPSAEITFHRAIDRSRDVLEALDKCLELGVDRVLTSGGAISAFAGIEVLARMVDHAGDRIVIAAAAGIDPHNVVEIVERTGVREVHFSVQRPILGRGQGSIMEGGDHHPGCDEAKLEGVLNALVKAGLR